MVEDPEARKHQWGGRRPGAGRPRRSDPRYRPSNRKRAGNPSCESPTVDETTETEAIPEEIVAKIRYLIAEMRSFKSTDQHKLEYQLAMLFGPPGGYIP